MVRIYYFAELREVTGLAEERMDLMERESWTVQELLSWLEQKYPAIQGKRFMVAVNEEYAAEGASIAAGDTVALIPPVSGG